MTSDPQEQARLAQLYAGMTPEELQKIADDAGSLTNMARQALVEEIDRRGLGIPLTEASSEDVIEKRNLVSIRRFRDLPEALLAKGGLESAGIECFLADHNMVRMDWFISNLLGGVKLLVNSEDAEDALTVLNQSIPENFDVQGIGEYQQPRCPNCQSLDVSFEELNKKIAYPSAWLGLPLPVHNRAWSCHSCGYHWEDTERTDITNSEQ
jgi:putative signal transducing protein